MRKIFSDFILILVTFGAFAEIRYVDADSGTNFSASSSVVVKNIDDFEYLIKTHKVQTLFLGYGGAGRANSSKTVETFFIVNGTVFRFLIEGYKNLEDFKKGKSLGFKTSDDYEEAMSLRITDKDFFYFYKANRFESLQEGDAAFKNGFKNSSDFYAAKKLDLKKYDDYKEYLEYTAAGFESKAEYARAKSKGFSRADEFRAATKGGFSNCDEYRAGQKLGLPTKSDLLEYEKITSAVEDLTEKLKTDKRNAFIYYFISCLPKGEMSLQKLSEKVDEMFSKKSAALKSSLTVFISPQQEKRRSSSLMHSDLNYYSENFGYNPVHSIFSVGNLQEFIKKVNFSEIATYDPTTDIFERK
ncbi:hypothetical protein [Treponema zioleckii]|uniref:hypothetical protein n=1 Tax=Treponema zioleckii TaxID=331680 RepID=UPI00168B81EC|nr:hypothetical protein [Treponema zioleckii]